MISNIILYLISFILFGWGTAHIIPTKKVVEGFGSLSDDNKRTISMEWIIEGITLIFISALISVVTYIDGRNSVSMAVYWMVFGILNTLSIISLFTGARNKFIMFKLCPYIFTGSSALLLISIFLLR